MKLGTQRICGIVKSLRTFSRLDEAELKAVDLHDGLDSALIILGHRLKPHGDRPAIEVVRHYESLPNVMCYSGNINQVFLNILANAIDAIDDRYHKQSQGRLDPQWATALPGRIELTTRLVDRDWAEIQITDSGLGIDAQVCDRIFDPFFTTKPIGKGTGLGLSISYQIVVDRHRGHLLCDSKPGQGTTFTIRIPIRQAAGEM
jgi:signal transduction histidine kinase